MIPEFEPVSLGRAAHQLGVEPFEIVRLVAAQAGPTGRLEFTPTQLDALRAFAGIEAWWGDGATFPSDTIPLRGVLRGVLARLLEKKVTGDNRTRQDNLWRGLPGKQRRFIEDAVDLLVEHGLASVRADVAGVMLSLRPEATERVQAIVDGKDVPEEFARLWG